TACRPSRRVPTRWWTVPSTPWTMDEEYATWSFSKAANAADARPAGSPDLPDINRFTITVTRNSSLTRSMRVSGANAVMNTAAINSAPSRAERRNFQRVRVKIYGRYMLEDRSEYPCQVIDMSP